jgi:hypothetical protein
MIFDLRPVENSIFVAADVSRLHFSLVFERDIRTD